MLADRPQNWNHQHWSHAIFAAESRVGLYRYGRRARGIHLFLGYNNPPSFQQHAEKLGHVYYSCRGWLWNNQQIAHETSADVLVLVPVCQHMRWRWRRRWWGVSLRHPSGCLERYRDAAKHVCTVWTKSRYQVRLTSSTLILNTERKLCHLVIRRRTPASFAVAVFNKWPRSPWVRLLFPRTWRKTF